MLMTQINETIQSGGLGAGNAFSIAASPKAFEILSSNLYQNKVLAVIREITCNAVDAHKMVGKPISDIKITMPTLLAPYFAVRDYGPGMSHEDVLALYTTYFRSTKDASNDLIGGFGLGSKSPFAVADQFTVTVWQRGIERSYVCYKKNSVPNINHIETGPSDQPDGVEVRVAVNTKTLSQWDIEAANLFKWWSVQPAGIKSVDYALAEKYLLAKSTTMIDGYPSWAISGYTTYPVVLMGGVPYSLNFTAVVGLDAKLIQAFGSLGLVLVFGVGELNISPSREALSYDPETCAAITTRLTNVVQQVVTEAEKVVASAPTLWDARQLVYGDTQPRSNASISGVIKQVSGASKTLYWNGLPVTRHIGFDLHKDFSAAATISWRKKAAHRKTWDATLTEEREWSNHTSTLGYYERWFWDDNVTAKSYRKAQYAIESSKPTWKDNYGNERNCSCSLYILSGIPFDEAAAFFLKKGLPPLQKISDLADPPKVASTTKRGAVTKGYIYNPTKNEWSRTIADIDLTTGGYCIDFFEGEPTDSFHSGKLSRYIKLGVVDSTQAIVGFTLKKFASKTMQDAFAKYGWTKLSGKLIEQIPLTLIYNDHYEATLRTMLGDRWSKHTSQRLEILSGYVKDKAFSDLVERLAKKWVAKNYSKVYPHDYCEHYSDEQQKAAYKAEAEAKGLYQEWVDYNHKHPLLKHTLNANDLSLSDIADYLNR